MLNLENHKESRINQCYELIETAEKDLERLEPEVNRLYRHIDHLLHCVREISEAKSEGEINEIMR